MCLVSCFAGSLAGCLEGCLAGCLGCCLAGSGSGSGSGFHADCLTGCLDGRLSDRLSDRSCNSRKDDLCWGHSGVGVRVVVVDEEGTVLSSIDPYNAALYLLFNTALYYPALICTIQH